MSISPHVAEQLAICVRESFEGFDKLHHALIYLSFSWGVDTPPHLMQANLDARKILARLEQLNLNMAEACHDHLENAQ